MIDKFYIQTNETIWDFLREIGKSKDVFSCRSSMEIDEYITYFYATRTEIVFVLLDYEDEGTIESADKGLFFNVRDKKTYKFFRKVLPNGETSKDSKDWRLSPIVDIYEHAKMMRRFLALSCQFSLVPAIHLMFLTSSRIVNYPKVVRTWQQNLFGISILQNLPGVRDMRYGDLPVNWDLNLEASEYWTKWQTYLENRGHFDWADDRWADWPQPSDKRYSWKGEMGHLISDEFKDENGQ
jgi:hypothetical protein